MGYVIEFAISRRKFILISNIPTILAYSFMASISVSFVGRFLTKEKLYSATLQSYIPLKNDIHTVGYERVIIVILFS